VCVNDAHDDGAGRKWWNRFFSRGESVCLVWIPLVFIYERRFTVCYFKAFGLLEYEKVDTMAVLHINDVIFYKKIGTDFEICIGNFSLLTKNG
jgi:hypothetical protein